MTKPHPWLIVGLGNPGATYQFTRHNVGKDAVVTLAQEHQSNFRRDRSGLMVADAFLGDRPGEGRAYLAYSTTFMNITGPPVAAFAKKFGIPVEQIIVAHDDLDLDPHRLRLKQGGGEGGHNGLRSISQATGSKNYLRLRMGIGRPPGRQDAADYVLAQMPKAAREEWSVTERLAAGVAADIIRDGFIPTQMALHSAN
ncbi:aminoacyl-tRNA hydrolase [Actinomyces minihominis]|uniref:aminoacyl-tRNA hydrolase n=1 Tax=Actinomyces minihominis TaxID=2002838 RepID=UPI000C0847ED|nr:aminoacyl-tRNA hydrolase [Actinomyces minihominis]